MDAESLRYFVAFRNSLIYIIFAAIVVGGAAYSYRARQPVSYQAKSQIYIGNVINDPDPDPGALSTGEALTPIYAELAHNYDVLEATILQLGLDMTTDQLDSRIQTSVVPDTPILVLRVTDGDPQRAIDMTNTLAQNLIAKSPSDLTDEQEENMAILAGLIDDMEAQIEMMNRQVFTALEEVVQARENGEDAEEIVVLADQYSRLIDQRSSAQNTLVQLSETFLQLANRTNILEIMEVARVARASGGLSPRIVGIAGAMVGAFLAGAVILLLEFLNDSLRNVHDVQARTNLPLLGSISRLPGRRLNPRERLIPHVDATSRLAEDFRKVQANFLSGERHFDEPRYLIVSSPSPGEGRTFVALNLAIMIAQLDMRVLLVDADLRDPQIGAVFKLEENGGLIDLLKTSPKKLSRVQAETVLKLRVSQSQRMPNLSILPAGTHDPQDLSLRVLGFNFVQEWLDVLLAAEPYDLIIFDTPPSRVYADAYSLSYQIPADVMLVFQAGRTQATHVAQSIQEFSQTRAKLVGSVLNKTRA